MQTTDTPLPMSSVRRLSSPLMAAALDAAEAPVITTFTAGASLPLALFPRALDQVLDHAHDLARAARHLGGGDVLAVDDEARHALDLVEIERLLGGVDLRLDLRGVPQLAE